MATSHHLPDVFTRMSHCHFFSFLIFTYLPAPGLSCGTWDLCCRVRNLRCGMWDPFFFFFLIIGAACELLVACGMHVGSSSPTKD